MFATAFVAVFIALCLTLAIGPVLAQPEPTPSLAVPYVPSTQPVIVRMLELARIKTNDVLYDLGCGDGRIVIAAAECGARGVGVDLNPRRIATATANAKSACVDDKVRFLVGDLFAVNVADATIVTLYLLPAVNRKLRPQLWTQLKVGARVLSLDFDMGPDWPPERVEQVGDKTLYCWIITEANKNAEIISQTMQSALLFGNR